MKTKNNVALIFGGSSGLGLQMAVRLARDGHAVVLAARNAERLDEAQRVIAAAVSSTAVSSVRCDVGNWNDVNMAGARAAQLGQLSTIVATAGSGWFGSIGDIPPEAVATVLCSNLHGMVHAGMLASRVSRDGHLRHFVGVLSTAAYQVRDSEALYSAAKSGARSFLEGLRKELRATGCRVMTVSPGGMRTAFWDKQPPPGASVSSFLDPAAVAEIVLANMQESGPSVSELLITRT